MYNFVDTIENTTNARLLPTEALYINGVCIENEIEGYTTLTVSGREPFNMAYSENQIGDRLYLEDYYQDSRIIEVEYRLIADTPEALMEKFNKLNGLLNFKEARILFEDEPEKYYIGTKTASDTPKKGRLNIVSTFEIYCPDPHKYSRVTKTFQASLNANGILEATIVNAGTASAPVNYAIKHHHDNGFIGIVSEYGVIQMGKIDEVDFTPYKQNEMLINTNAFTEFADDTGENAENPDKLTNGKLAVGEISGEKMLHLSESGTGANTTHGGMISFTLPPDSEGKTGAVNFYSFFRGWFETGLVNQIATMSINYLDGDDNLIFSYIIEKIALTSNIARVLFRVGGNSIKTYFTANFTPSYQEGDNPYNFAHGHADVVKEGGKISAYFNGGRKEINVPELENVACEKVQIYIGQHGDTNFISRAYFRSFLFQKLNVEKWADSPNRYSDGSEVVVNGKEGKIYVNGILRMSDEIKGSQYFQIPPGETKIQFYYSDFSDPPPAVTAEIREGWL